MNEMEFLRIFEFRPTGKPDDPIQIVQCWKRNGGIYGEIREYTAPKEYEVHEGNNFVGVGSTFNQAFKVLRNHLEGNP
jgi:hypothetical protein